MIDETSKSDLLLTSIEYCFIASASNDNSVHYSSSLKVGKSKMNITRFNRAKRLNVAEKRTWWHNIVRRLDEFNWIKIEIFWQFDSLMFVDGDVIIQMMID